MKAELKAAGVDHFLDVNDNSWANADADALKDAAHKIGMETGLTAELGTTTEGADNVFAADDTKTGADNDRDNGVFVSIALKSGAGKMPGGGLTLQIGDTPDSYNQMKVVVGDIHTKALGIAGVDISNQEGAAAAIQTIRLSLIHI